VQWSILATQRTDARQLENINEEKNPWMLCILGLEICLRKLEPEQNFTKTSWCLWTGVGHMVNRTKKTTSGLLPPWMIVSGIDCSSLAQFEYVHKTRQRVSIVALTWSEITLIGPGEVGPVVLVVNHLPTWRIITSVGVSAHVPGALVWVFRWIATVPRSASRYQAFSTVVAADQKWFSRTVNSGVAEFCRRR